MTSPAASRNVDAYIEVLPQPQQAIATRLREMLFEAVPNVEERFSFRLPFYHYHGMFCYIRAADGVVYLCFCRGKDLKEAFTQLEQKERAAICCVRIGKLKDVALMEVAALLVAAADWNKEAAERKIPMVQKRGAKTKTQSPGR